MNDWLPIGQALRDGSLCSLRFRDPHGLVDLPGLYFLHSDGCWYLVNPPRRVRKAPTHFKLQVGAGRVAD